MSASRLLSPPDGSSWVALARTTYWICFRSYRRRSMSVEMSDGLARRRVQIVLLRLWGWEQRQVAEALGVASRTVRREEARAAGLAGEVDAVIGFSWPRVPPARDRVSPPMDRVAA